MKKTNWLLALCLLAGLLAIAPSNLFAKDRYYAGLAVIGGLEDIGDVYDQNVSAEGYIPTAQTIAPMGASFLWYHEISDRFGIGGGLGPIFMVNYSGEGISKSMFDFPLNFNCKFSPLKGDFSPYVRAGLQLQFATGSYVVQTHPGMLAGFGFDFSKTKKEGFSTELIFDSSSIEFQKVVNGKSVEVKPFVFTLSFYASF